HFYHLTIGELIDQDLIAHVHRVVRGYQAKLFQHSGWWNTTASLLEVATHGSSDILELRGILIHQAQLHGVIAIGPRRRFLLHDYTRSSLDYGDRCHCSVGGEQLCHADFSSDDSVNHCSLDS